MPVNRKVSAPSSHRAHLGGLRQVTGMTSDGQGLAPWRGSWTRDVASTLLSQECGARPLGLPPAQKVHICLQPAIMKSHHHSHWASYSGNFTRVKFNRSRYRSRLEHRFFNLLNGPDCSPRFLSIHCIPHSHNCTTVQGQQRVYYKNHGREGLSLSTVTKQQQQQQQTTITK